jgi:hypothetical protein
MEFFNEKYGSFDVQLTGIGWFDLHDFSVDNVQVIKEALERLDNKHDITFVAKDYVVDSIGNILPGIRETDSLCCTVALKPYPIFVVELESGARLPLGLAKKVEQDLSKEMTDFVVKELADIKRMVKVEIINELESQLIDIKSTITKVEDYLCNLT